MYQSINSAEIFVRLQMARGTGPLCSGVANPKIWGGQNLWF